MYVCMQSFFTCMILSQNICVFFCEKSFPGSRKKNVSILGEWISYKYLLLYLFSIYFMLI